MMDPSSEQFLSFSASATTGLNTGSLILYASNSPLFKNSNWSPAIILVDALHRLFTVSTSAAGIGLDLSNLRVTAQVTTPSGIILSPIPLPGALPLFGSILGAAALWRWRRQRIAYVA